MSCYKTKSRLIAILAGVLTVCVMVPGCSEKITNSHAGDRLTVTVSMTLSAAAGVETLDQFRLIVQADDMETDTVRLQLQGGYLVGVVEVPRGLARRFTAEALDAQGVVIYRGTTVANIGAAAANDVSADADTYTVYIDLYPVVPLVNITPHYTSVPMNSGFSVDVSVYLVPELYSVDLNLSYSDSPVDFDTILKGSGLDEGSAISYSVSYPTARIQVFRTSPGILVDATGHAHLATVNFRSYADWEADTATAILGIELLSMWRYAGAQLDSIPLEGIHTDQATVGLYRVMFAGD